MKKWMRFNFWSFSEFMSHIYFHEIHNKIVLHLITIFEIFMSVNSEPPGFSETRPYSCFQRVISSAVVREGKLFRPFIDNVCQKMKPLLSNKFDIFVQKMTLVDLKSFCKNFLAPFPACFSHFIEYFTD